MKNEIQLFSSVLLIQPTNTGGIFTPEDKIHFGVTVVCNGICFHKIISKLCFASFFFFYTLYIVALFLQL